MFRKFILSCLMLCAISVTAIASEAVELADEKGLDISEIARVRNCAEGTVKAHLHAIHRKSGGRNRRELLSLLVDSLLAGKT